MASPSSSHTISSPLSHPTHRSTNWTPSPSHHANGHTLSPPPPYGLPPTVRPPTSPSGTMSLAGTSLRAFLLGLTLGSSLSGTAYLTLISPHPLWRLPFFLTALSTFHFLEYYLTARYNHSAATLSAFLLSQNGAAYNVAHVLAFTEIAVRHVLLGGWQERRWWYDSRWDGWVMAVGFVMLAVGQATRSSAMKEAGSNFNHVVQKQRREGHELVKTGLYAVLRHPSYFGFFWWSLGTQVVLGNTMCLAGYAVVLWHFFNTRILTEEKLLVDFFGNEYEDYKKRTIVGIPFIK